LAENAGIGRLIEVVTNYDASRAGAGASGRAREFLHGVLGGGDGGIRGLLAEWPHR